jgi:chromosome segregation ATPase
MSKFGTFLGFTPSVVAGKPSAPAAPDGVAPDTASADRNVIELDQELFFPIAGRLGEENETVRNLLIDAEHKISELDSIKRSIGKLVDPVSKTLRALEEAKNEKLSLQGALSSTRAAFEKQRAEFGAVEKKATVAEGECTRLREMLTVAQQSVAALETTRAEQSAELASRRSQIADLQRQVQQQATDLQTSRDESRRFAERIAMIDKRMVQLEAETTGAQQKLLLSEKEKSAVQGLLEKALAESAQISRRLLDTDKALGASSARLSQIEAAFAEAQSERTRLASALDETNEKHRSEMIAQRARYEALQARADLSDKLLDEARQTLASRADEVSAFDRRVAEAVLNRSSVESKLAQIEAALADRDARIKELELSHAAIAEHNETLVKAIGTRESAFSRAQEKLQAQDNQVQLLENQLRASREATELQIEELNAQLQRERLERTMAEGALEAGRKDIARLLREVATLQYRPPGAANDQPAPMAQPRRQNAA